MNYINYCIFSGFYKNICLLFMFFKMFEGGIFWMSIPKQINKVSGFFRCPVHFVETRDEWLFICIFVLMQQKMCINWSICALCSEGPTSSVVNNLFNPLKTARFRKNPKSLQSRILADLNILVLGAGWC